MSASSTSSMDESKSEEVVVSTDLIAQVTWEQWALITEEHFHTIKCHQLNTKVPLGHKGK